jgi:hypothetical protein
VDHGQRPLLEVVLAAGARGGLADLLDGGQQHAHQDGDDGNDDEQLDQREAKPPGRRRTGIMEETHDGSDTRAS